jgi:hypothetical protein
MQDGKIVAVSGFNGDLDLVPLGETAWTGRSAGLRESQGRYQRRSGDRFD